jgi:acid stress chaperone HdeB
MTNPKLLLPGLIVALFSTSGAQAQVTIDISKVTCEQFVQYQITNDENIAIWLYGYYNGKRGNTVVEPQKFKANANKVKRYCIMNSNVTVMQAVETVLGPGK